MKQEDFQNLNYSMLGHSCVLKGELQISGDITICSHVEGSLQMLDDGRVTIERFGKFNGNIDCHSIEIFGQVEGNIRAKEKIVVRSSAQLNGKVLSGQLGIYPGAIVNIEGHTKED